MDFADRTSGGAQVNMHIAAVVGAGSMGIVRSSGGPQPVQHDFAEEAGFVAVGRRTRHRWKVFETLCGGKTAHTRSMCSQTRCSVSALNNRQQVV